MWQGIFNGKGKQRLIAFSLALVFGLWIGSTFRYQSLFVEDTDLYPIILAPCLLLGALAGCRCGLECLLLLLVTACLLWTRSLIGRPVDSGYLRFTFSLTVLPVLQVGVYGIGAAYLAAGVRFLIICWHWKNRSLI